MKDQMPAFSRLLAQAGANGGRAIDAQTLVFAALNLHDPEDKPFASEFELAHPLQFLMANQVAAPLLRQVIPSGVQAPSMAAGASSDDIAELRHQIDLLKTVMEKQANAIERLSNPHQ